MKPLSSATRQGRINATPSGNGIAAQGLLRLSVLTGDNRYAEAAERCLKLYFPTMQQAASQFSSLCTALEASLRSSSILVLCGAEKETTAWKAAVSARYLPELMTIALPENAADLPPFLAKPNTPTTAAWLCHGTQCLPPIHQLDELLAAL